MSDFSAADLRRLAQQFRAHSVEADEKAYQVWVDEEAYKDLLNMVRLDARRRKAERYKKRKRRLRNQPWS